MKTRPQPSHSNDSKSTTDTVCLAKSPTWSSDEYISDISFQYNQESLLSASDETFCRPQDIDDKFVFVNGKTRNKSQPRLMLGCISPESLGNTQVQKTLTELFKTEKTGQHKTQEKSAPPRPSSVASSTWKSLTNVVGKQYKAWNLNFVYDMMACSDIPRTDVETTNHAPPRRSNSRRSRGRRSRSCGQSKSRKARSKSKSKRSAVELPPKPFDESSGGSMQTASTTANESGASTEWMRNTTDNGGVHNEKEVDVPKEAPPKKQPARGQSLDQPMSAILRTSAWLILKESEDTDWQKKM